MGKKTARGARGTQKEKHHQRTIWSQVERNVRRDAVYENKKTDHNLGSTDSGSRSEAHPDTTNRDKETRANPDQQDQAHISSSVAAVGVRLENRLKVAEEKVGSIGERAKGALGVLGFEGAVGLLASVTIGLPDGLPLL